MQQINSAVVVGQDAKLWQMVDALRNHMDAAKYEHVLLGCIFSKYISGAFEAKHAELEAQRAQRTEPKDPDEYRAQGIFLLLKEARYKHLKASALVPTIGTLVDDGMSAIEERAWVQHVLLPGGGRGTPCARITHRAGAT